MKNLIALLSLFLWIPILSMDRETTSTAVDYPKFHEAINEVRFKIHDISPLSRNFHREIADPSSIDEKSDYFNTAFLANYDKVASKLIAEEGFKEVKISVANKHRLHGLWLGRDDARYNVILFAGFYPGRKEGLAPLYKLLPPDCNILMVDARGHGKSEGRFASALYKYGKEEYQDVTAAIDFVSRSCNNDPIFIHGTCIGAFHTAHAMIELNKSHHNYNIKGLIFDSMPTSIISMLSAPRIYIASKVLAKKFDQNTFLQRCLSLCARAALTTILYPLEWIAWPIVKWRDHYQRLIDKVNTIKYPILYIHAEDDTLAPIARVKELATQSKNATTWWITQESDHANHFLKHKHEYQKQMFEFINTTIA